MENKKIDRGGLDMIMDKYRVANKDVYAEMANLFDIQVAKL